MSETKKVAAKKSTHVVKEAPGKAAVVIAPKTAKGAPKHSRKISIAPGQRNAMIAETAYYRAEQRGFADGDPVVDWLWADYFIPQQITRRTSMPIGEICNRAVVFAKKDTSLLEVAQLMRQNHVGDVVIVDQKNGRRVPVGILLSKSLPKRLISIL